jgi:CheY-like chemotaxis protein
MSLPVKVSPQYSDKKLILCIDDHRQGLHARRLILEAAGYDVITATSGRIGLRLLERHPVQLVILDYRMPKMNGAMVAREIRRTHPHVPIIMLSGQIEVPADVPRAVDAFVPKGEPPTVLLGYLTLLAEGVRRKRLPGKAQRAS